MKTPNEVASELGSTFYVDIKTGKKVLTTYYLSKRGHCCHQECLNCPYEQQNEQSSIEDNNFDLEPSCVKSVVTK